MSYLDQQQSLRQRAASGGIALGVQVAVGAALITGLTISGLAPERSGPLIGINVPIDPPPPPVPQPSPPVTPPTQNMAAPIPPLVLTPAPAQPVEVLDPLEHTTTYIPAPPSPAPTFAPAPSPAPSFTPKRAQPLGNPGSWISTDDYPAAPLRRGIEGQAAYRVVVGSDGKVSACELTRSSGNVQLDQATCRYIERRARFSPATDSTGATVVGTYSGTVQWQIPE